MQDAQEPTDPQLAPPRPALPVVDYSTPPARNRSAARAMLFALLGFLPFVPGILAVRYGRRGMREADADPRIGGRGVARTANVLGIISIVVWTVLTISAVPAAIHARRQALRVQCMSQMRQIGIAAIIYAQTNKGFLPPTLDELAKAKIIPPALFTCPACAGDPAKPAASSGAYGTYNYGYLGAGRKISAIRRASDEPLLFEPMTNHTDPGINVLFCDGHVEFIRGNAGAAMAAKLAAAATQPATTQPAPAQVPQSPRIEQ
jgi:prepilin-type processing-associated H-X9-DG protein